MLQNTIGRLSFRLFLWKKLSKCLYVFTSTMVTYQTLQSTKSDFIANEYKFHKTERPIWRPITNNSWSKETILCVNTSSECNVNSYKLDKTVSWLYLIFKGRHLKNYQWINEREIEIEPRVNFLYQSAICDDMHKFHFPGFWLSPLLLGKYSSDRIMIHAWLHTYLQG